MEYFIQAELETEGNIYSPQLNYNYFHIVKTYGKTTFYLQKT